MSNQFDFVCPNCGDDDTIDITASIDVRLTYDGTDADESMNGNHEWDDDSPASCECGWSGTVADLDPDKPEAGQPYSVLVLYPDCDRGTETFFSHVRAANPRDAAALVQAEASATNSGCIDADDFDILAVIDGHIEVALSALDVQHPNRSDSHV